MSFVTSATDVADLPATEAEVAVVGRSNVGKSSLINALANRKNLAHTSKTPGRTQLINLFALDNKSQTPTHAFVDLPGYGFANVPAKVQAAWQPMIEAYLTDRESLAMIMVLVDGAVGPTKLDVQMLEWLRSLALPHTVVATKHDKVKAAKRDARKKELAEGCRLETGDIVWTSASKAVGIEKLRDLTRLWLDLDS